MINLARSTYYYQPKSKSSHLDDQLLKEIRRIIEEFPRYGYRRITQQLKREGFKVNHKRIYRLMKNNNLSCKKPKKFRVYTTDSNHAYPIYRNLLTDLEIVKLNQVWVSDITYIRILTGFVYLAVILDAYSRKVVGYAISRKIDKELVLAALKAALETRKPPKGIIHHSDRGVQYASHDYVDCLKENHFQISMSGKGNPYDNAQAESFMKTLKYEEVYLSEYKTFEDVIYNIPRFIEEVYNRRRLHSSLKYLPPEEFEQNLKKAS